MTPAELISYCLAKNGAYEDHPFGPDSVIIKVGRTESRSGRIFAQVFRLKGQDMATLNCEPMTGDFYRSQYPGVVVRGYHCPPVQQPHFSTFPLDRKVPDGVILEMADHSYQVVVSKLPKAVQRLLAAEQEGETL